MMTMKPMIHIPIGHETEEAWISDETPMDRYRAAVAARNRRLLWQRAKLVLVCVAGLALGLAYHHFFN